MSECSVQRIKPLLFMTKNTDRYKENKTLKSLDCKSILSITITIIQGAIYKTTETHPVLNPQSSLESLKFAVNT